MFTAFLDDSGSDPSDPIFVLAGFMSTPNRWLEFSDAWERGLRKPQAIEYFKMSEANAGEGQFKRGWNRPLIDQRVDELTEVACEYSQFRIASVMRWSDYARYVKDVGDQLEQPFSLLFRDPYSLCLMGLKVKIKQYCIRNGIDPICDYVCDEQGAVGDFAGVMMQNIHNPELRELVGGAPAFRNDKRVLPLQAADLYAWHVRKKLTEHTSEIYRHIRVQIDRVPSISIWMDHRYLSGLRANLFASMVVAPQFLRS